MYNIIFSNKFRRQLKKLDKEFQRRVLKILERTRLRPHSYFQRLVGKKTYRLRVGNYRIIADIEGEHLVILILEIGHRKNIYN